MVVNNNKQCHTTQLPSATRTKHWIIGNTPPEQVDVLNAGSDGVYGPLPLYNDANQLDEE